MDTTCARSAALNYSKRVTRSLPAHLSNTACPREENQRLTVTQEQLVSEKQRGTSALREVERLWVGVQWGVIKYKVTTCSLS